MTTMFDVDMNLRDAFLERKADQEAYVQWWKRFVAGDIQDEDEEALIEALIAFRRPNV